MKVFAIAHNTFREAIRNYIVYSVLSFAALLIGVSAFFGAVTIGDQIKVIKDFGLFCLSFSGAVLTIVTGVSLLNKELKQKTIFNILSKPVHRWQFILGKYLGLTGTVCILVALMGSALVLFSALFERRIDWLLFQGIFLVMLEVSVLAAVTMFFSSLVVTTTLTALFTLAAYIAGRSIAYLSYFLQQSEQPNPALAGVLWFFDTILPDLTFFNAAGIIVYGGSLSLQQAGLAVVYAISYSAAALTLAALIFARRELV